MSIGKFDQERQPNFEMDQPELLSHYDNVAVRTLLSIQRHWQLIASLVALARPVSSYRERTSLWQASTRRR
jgi:hypothetical protein